MTFARKYKITDAEREALIQQVAKRFRDYVFIEAEHWTRETLSRLFNKYGIKKTDTLNLTFTIQQVIADVLVELGSHRRKHHPDLSYAASPPNCDESSGLVRTSLEIR